MRSLLELHPKFMMNEENVNATKLFSPTFLNFIITYIQ
jgi:hypothetical protein